jgi:tetratricopeptide (TPR) repeat protein
MDSAESQLSEAYALYQSGAFAEAEAIAQRLFINGVRGAALAGLCGMTALQLGRSHDAVPHLRSALAETPANLALRSSLAFALVNSGDFEGARKVAEGADVPQLRRIIAFVDHQQGRAEQAIAGYRRVLAEFPQDYESWNNLGLLLAAAGELSEAVEAFDRSGEVRPEASVHINRSRALARGARHLERQIDLRAAVRQFADNAALHVELGLAEAACGDFAAAEIAYHQALRLDPALPAAYLEYGMLLEALNRLSDMRVLIAQAHEIGLEGGEIAFVEAWLFKREGRFVEALQRAETTAAKTEPSRHAQLVGEIYDQLGDPDRAFAAFSEMNRISASDPSVAFAEAQDFPGRVVGEIERLTSEAIAGWSRGKVKDQPPSPVFILGFPRSGTTLLDTLLMNLSELQIFEEAPMVERVEAMLDSPGQVGTLSDGELELLRQAYFKEANAVQALDGRTIVDKFPLHLVRIALIHRLFPEARLILVERHPCDVILSCFMARFQVNKAMVQFRTLEGAARLYDLAMTAWTRAEELLPLSVHRVRYEHMVADLAGEMRPLLAFLGLPWRDEVLDNHASAVRRRHIATASYAQVVEPIYSRAAYRWERYRSHIEPVLPILMPWIERLGYSI